MPKKENKKKKKKKKELKLLKKKEAYIISRCLQTAYIGRSTYYFFLFQDLKQLTLMQNNLK